MLRCAHVPDLDLDLDNSRYSVGPQTGTSRRRDVRLRSDLADQLTLELC